MQYLSQELIEKHINIKDIIEADKKAFSLMEKGLIEVPLRTSIKANNGTLLFMPAYSSLMNMAVLKNVNVYLDNTNKGLSTTPAEIMLIDASNGYLLAILDGTYVTKLRTGAASGAAFDILAKGECYKGALIGTGGQAETQLDAMLAVRDLKEVSIYSLHSDRCTSFVERMKNKYRNKDVSITCAFSANDAIKDADLIITVTTSNNPVFDGKLVKKGATVSCVGTYEPNKREIDSYLIEHADKIYCDNKEAALQEAGDILIPISQGIINADDIKGSLGEVINGNIKGRENDEEIIVFKTVGIAAEDLVASAVIYNKINNKN